MEISQITLFINKILPLAFSLIGFGLLIAVHEFGHFIFCKLFNIHTPTFSIGFGPELYQRQIGKTKFRIAAIPLGGYVEIAGLAEVGQGDQQHAQDTSTNAFNQKPYWQKAFVLLGGILFNIIFAYLAFCLIFIVGNSKAPKNNVSIMSIVQNSPAERAGLQKNDAILAINDQTLSSDPVQLSKEINSVILKEIQTHPNAPITLLIKRDQQEPQPLTVTLGSRQEGEREIGMIGAAFSAPQLPFLYAFRAGLDYTKTILTLIVQSLANLFKNRNLDGAGGPVMILSQGASTAKQGFIPLLHFLGLISLSLAIMNLLPIGALDGGQLLFVTIEFIIRRQVPEIVKLTINLASWFFLIGLMLYLTFRDINTIFGNTIKTMIQSVINLFK